MVRSIVIAGLALGLGVAGALVAAIPETTLDDEGNTYWVTETLLLDAKGEPNWQVLGYRAGLEVERLLAQGRDDGECRKIWPPVINPPPLRSGGTGVPSSFEQLIDRSSWILHGRVVNRQAGMAGESLGYTLEIEPIATYRGAKDRSNRLLFVPYGTVHIGRYCYEKMGREGLSVPEIDDEVLFFSSSRSQNHGEEPLAANDWSLMRIERQGEVHKSTQLEFPDVTKQELIGLLEKQP